MPFAAVYRRHKPQAGNLSSWKLRSSYVDIGHRDFYDSLSVGGLTDCATAPAPPPLICGVTRDALTGIRRRPSTPIAWGCAFFRYRRRAADGWTVVAARRRSGIPARPPLPGQRASQLEASSPAGTVGDNRQHGRFPETPDGAATATCRRSSHDPREVASTFPKRPG